MSAGVSDCTLRRPLLHSSFLGPVIQYDTIRDAILTENCPWVGLGWVGSGWVEIFQFLVRWVRYNKSTENLK